MTKVGIVLVSHSPKVVEGLKDIIRQVVKDVPIEIAGGTDDYAIGTSVNKIRNAIVNAYSDKGVLLFFDLGSAMMNAEVAIKLSGYEKVEVADVPLIEGAYVAAIESGLGKSLEEVLDSCQSSFVKN